MWFLRSFFHFYCPTRSSAQTKWRDYWIHVLQSLLTLFHPSGHIQKYILTSGNTLGLTFQSKFHIIISDNIFWTNRHNRKEIRLQQNPRCDIPSRKTWIIKQKSTCSVTSTNICFFFKGTAWRWSQTKVIFAF